MVRFPAKFLNNAARAGTENRWITGSALSHTQWNRVTRYFRHGITYLPYGITFAQPDVVRTHSGLVGFFQGADMRTGNIQNMHIITQACAIRSWVIITVDIEIIPLAASGLKQQRNNVSFRIM